MCMGERRRSGSPQNPGSAPDKEQLSLFYPEMAQQFRIRGRGRFGFRNIQLVKTEEHSLGIGSYGAVYRARCDQLVCAAKVLHPILFQTRDLAAHRIVERFQQEIDFLSGLRHPNVIQYLGSCPDPESGLPVLFMELMDDSLTGFLERPGADAPPLPLPLHVQVNIGHDVAQALCHLHRHEVLHRDLSSNNVLLIGRRQVKVTDFGMAKLLGEDPCLTPTYCPGTNGYMSPEALAEPPSYTTKLDIFSCGVLFVQLITRKFPNPLPRTYTLQISDPRVPSGRVLVEVPELERRKEHLDLISPTHPLLMVALDCLKDKEDPRPTAEQLCSRLIGLKESRAYQDSLQQSPEEVAVVAAPVRDHELEQQLRETESRVEDLTREVEQLQLQKDELDREKSEAIRQKNAEIQQKSEHIELLQRKLQGRSRENEHLEQQLQASEQVVAALQQSVDQKDTELQAKVELLQEKERVIQDLQQRVRGEERRDVATGPLRLEWRDGPRAPFITYGESVAVNGGIVYCRDGVSNYKILMFNSETGQWTVLQSCPKRFFSIAIVNGQLTAIGGEHSDTATKTLLSLPLNQLDTSQQKWTEQFPPMTYYHNIPAVVTTNTSLIVAGGFGPHEKKAPVEVMNTQTLHWSTVASLPHPLSQATATICGSRLYLGSGYSKGDWTKSVLMCEVSDLLQSQPPSLATRSGLSHSRQVWREICELPVKRSSLITLQGQLLAVGGGATTYDSTSEVRQYDAATNSWNVISRMKVKRRACFVAVLPKDRVMVCGGLTPNVRTDSVEIASVMM